MRERSTVSGGGVGWTLAEDGPDVRRVIEDGRGRVSRLEKREPGGRRSRSDQWGGRSNRGSKRGPDRGKAASRRAVVVIHVVLVGLAGLVVWVTLGGDPKGVATGASREAPAVPGAEGGAGDGVVKGVEGPVTGRGEVASGKRAGASSFVVAGGSGAGASARSGVTGVTGGAGVTAGVGWGDGGGEAVVLASAVPRAVVTYGENGLGAGGAAEPGGGAAVAGASPAGGGASLAAEVASERPAPVPAVAPPHDAAAEAFAECGQLYGLPGAERVVYLVDASGSLVDTFPFLLDELRRCITSLQPEQSYAIVFFRGAEVVEVPPLGMHKADTHALSRTVRWLDPQRKSLIPRGTARPDAALRRAFAYQPDAIVLVSDDLTGRVDPEGERLRLLQLITSVNLNHTVIHTAQLRHRDPLATPDRMGTLELIAFTTGGTHRYIREADLAPATDVTVPDAPPAIRF